MSSNTNITFFINSWDHLYSLKSAIERKHQATGKTLSIKGRIRDNAFTQHQDTAITIDFINTHGNVDYPVNTFNNPILGTMQYQNQQLHTQLTIDDAVFEELRKNLMEYSDIEGIHIAVRIELEGEPDINAMEKINILDLTYAMKGDT